MLRISQYWKLLFPKSILKFSLTSIPVENMPQHSSQTALKLRLSFTLTTSVTTCKVCGHKQHLISKNWFRNLLHNSPHTAICRLLVRTLKVTFPEELSWNMRSGMRVSARVFQPEVFNPLKHFRKRRYKYSTVADAFSLFSFCD